MFTEFFFIMFFQAKFNVVLVFLEDLLLFQTTVMFDLMFSAYFVYDNCTQSIHDNLRDCQLLP